MHALQQQYPPSKALWVFFCIAASYSPVPPPAPCPVPHHVAASSLLRVAIHTEGQSALEVLNDIMTRELKSEVDERVMAALVSAVPAE